jgi:hypothetical protein
MKEPIPNCEICNDDGLCRNNENHPDYDSDFSDYLDCIGYSKSKEKRDYSIEVWNPDVESINIGYDNGVIVSR